MAGPTVLLYLPHKLTDVQIAQIHADVLAVSDGTFESGIWDWDFHVIDTRPIGGGYVFDEYFGGGIPFGIAKEAGDNDEGEWKEVQKAFGFLPQQTLQLDAMVSGETSHRVLGEFALHYATLFDGIINFDGPLLPHSMRENGWREDWSVMNGEWSEVKVFADAMVASLPGKAVAIEYKTATGKTWACHYGDATFLRAWLQHPHFHMIK